MESVPITTNVVSSNLIHGKVYSIQHYMIKFVSDLRQVSGFLRVFRFPPSKKIDSRSHDITKILLKLALNTINQPTFYTENFIILESFIFQEIHVFFYTCNKMLMYIWQGTVSYVELIFLTMFLNNRHVQKSTIMGLFAKSAS